MLSPLLFPKIFPADLVFHGIFNRHAGISSAPYDLLNVSYGVGDDPQQVEENRQRIKDHLGAEVLISGKQVHATNIYVTEKTPQTDMELAGFDAFISNIPGIALMVQQADCQAVMLCDPDKKVVANIHCGWRGSVSNIISKTIFVMKKRFNCKPAALLATISPALGPCCAEFVNYRTELPAHLHGFQVKPNYFDFPAISRQQLCEAGVKTCNIATAPICTVCDRDWFSYRREGTTGRFCSVIGITK